MKEQRLEGSKHEGDCEEGDDDFKLKVGEKLWKRARRKLWKLSRHNNERGNMSAGGAGHHLHIRV
jgi:hypothetical protein